MNKGVKHKEKGDKFEGVRKKLIGMRQAILSEAKAEVDQILSEEDKYNGVSDDGDFADVAFRDAMQASKLTRHRLQLRDIEEALRKIEFGTYGICDDCEEEIPIGRLNVMPFALRCVDCQEKHEMMSSEAEETAVPLHESSEGSND
ncbi:DnaK suppressor protein [Candidatus Sulfobium mesophilum]|uniref:DnaK suppressor protein n=1 Tax=Candidatus Sulfobium mesophilum TaxID=2016548 RepID=A0A2U3QKC6_9BACT|nr:DnaK suppressor protein [Candidatus Sulfobium mesophilum]